MSNWPEGLPFNEAAKQLNRMGFTEELCAAVGIKRKGRFGLVFGGEIYHEGIFEDYVETGWRVGAESWFAIIPGQDERGQPCNYRRSVFACVADALNYEEDDESEEFRERLWETVGHLLRTIPIYFEVRLDNGQESDVQSDLSVAMESVGAGPGDSGRFRAYETWHDRENPAFHHVRVNAPWRRFRIDDDCRAVPVAEAGKPIDVSALVEAAG